MPTQSTRLGLSKFASNETGWGSATTANWDTLDNTPLGHCNPRAQATPNMAIRVAAGIVYVTGSPIYYAGGNSPTFTAPTGGNNRIDLVYLTSGGVLSILSGAQAGSPSPPAYPANAIPICEVYLRTSTTAIYDSDQGVGGYIYRDVRPFVGPLATGSSGVTGIHVFGSGDITGSVELVEGSGVDLIQSGQQVTVKNIGVRGVKRSGGTTLGDGDVTLAAGSGLAISEDVPTKTLTIYQTTQPGMTNPMNATGDLIVAGATGTPLRMGVGTNGQVLSVVGGFPTWQPPSTGKRAASRTVATSTSLATSQAGADYVCDGTADQVEINQAITDLATSGGEVVLLEGTYVLSGSIVLTSNIRIMGRGAILKVRNSHGATLDVLTAGAATANIELASLRIDGNRINQAVTGQNGIVVANNVDNITIRDCWIKSFAGSGIKQTGTQTKLRLVNVYIQDCTSYGADIQGDDNVFLGCYFGQNTTGLHLANANRNTFTGCTFYDETNHLIMDTANQDNLFTGCRFIWSTQDGAVVTASTRGVFASCTFQQNGLAAGNTYTQLKFGASAVNNSVQACTFFGGTTGNKSKYGVWVGAGATGTTVYPNTFPDGGGQTDDIKNDGSTTYLGPDITTQRSNTFVVAAVDATTDQKNGADYVCDGTADDVEWQAALDACHAAGGGSVLAVGTTFNFAQQVTVGNDISIEGDSVGTIVKWANSVGNNIGLFQKRLDVSNPTNFVMFNLTLDGNKANQTNTQHGLNLNGFVRPRIERVTAQNFRGSGILLTSCDRAFLLECAANSSNDDGFHLTSCTNVELVACYAASNTDDGIHAATTENLSCIACTTLDNGGDGVYLLTTVGVTLLGCGIRRSIVGASSVLKGIVTSGAATTSIVSCYIDRIGTAIELAGSSSDTTITSCYLSGETGLYVNGATEVRAVSNFIQGNSGPAISLANGVSRSTFTNNFIWPFSTYGIGVADNTTDVDIINNIFYSGTSVQVNIDGAATARVRVTGNRFQSVRTGVYVVNGVGITIDNNDIFAAQNYGIRVAASPQYLAIRNNFIYQGQDYGINIYGSDGAVVQGNVVTLVGTTGYTTPSTGFYATGSLRLAVIQNQFNGCYGKGLHVVSCQDIEIRANRVSNNHEVGVYIDACTGGDFAQNRVWGNGQRTDLAYENVVFASTCTAIRILGNYINKGTNSNRPSIGLNLGSQVSGCRIDNENTLVNGGVVADVLNFSTSLVRSIGFCDATLPNALTSWSWGNQGTATASVDLQGLHMLAPSAGAGDQLRLLTQLTSSPPYSAVAHLTGVIHGKDFGAYGVCWYDGTKVTLFGFEWDSGLKLSVANYTNVTTFSANQYQAPAAFPFPWLRLRDDNSNRYAEVSADGTTWITMVSFTRTTFMTPTRVGVALNPANAATPNLSVALNLISWTK